MYVCVCGGATPTFQWVGWRHPIWEPIWGLLSTDPRLNTHRLGSPFLPEAQNLTPT